MRDGDIFSWRWKPSLGRNNGAPFGDYHCKSRIAVFEDGVLRDTYWHSPGEGRLNLDDIELTLRGNRHEMTEIREWDIPNYRHEDIVDMRHSNNTRAKIYLKPGAVKNAERMEEEARHRLEMAEADRRVAKSRIARWKMVLEEIRNGNLDAVSF